MQCLKCKAEHDVLQKYCTECGGTMGVLCDQCGTINPMDARHCGSCGQGLLASLKKAGGAAQSATPIKTRQYTLSEIEELLIVRKQMMAEEESTRILKQNDIDNLFQ